LPPGLVLAGRQFAALSQAGLLPPGLVLAGLELAPPLAVQRASDVLLLELSAP